jgi:hypothetical protein
MIESTGRNHGVNTVSEFLKKYESWIVRAIAITGLLASLVKLVEEVMH